MELKPQDLLVVLKLLAINGERWSYAILSESLAMSPSQLHSAMKRALKAQLAVNSDEGIVPNLRNLEEFLLHGIKFVFVPENSAMVRGLPTAHAASPLKEFFVENDEPIPVWPHAKGDVRGVGFSPLYKLAPDAALNDPILYELLVLVDALRGGRAREQSEAAKLIKEKIEQYGK